MKRHMVGLVLVVLLRLVTAGCGGESSTTPSSPQRYSESVEESSAVGDSITLAVDNFAGRVTLHEGAAGNVRVVATKWASRVGDLALVTVEVIEQQGVVYIATDTPVGLKNASVELDITAPPDTEFDVKTGVGKVSCRGRPRGDCSFTTGTGNVELELPTDVNLSVDLTTGVGSIDLGGFTVSGVVQPQRVTGTIGSGDEGDVRARTGVGDIRLIPQ